MKNYLGATLGLTLLVTLLLCGLSLIAPSAVMGFKLKQANILADIVSDSAMRAAVGLPPIPEAGDDMLAMWVDDEYLESPVATDSLFRADMLEWEGMGADDADGVTDSTFAGPDTTVDTAGTAIGETMTGSVVTDPESGTRYVYSKSTAEPPAGLTPIKDYSPEGNSLRPFFEKLDEAAHLERPVRIAVLGDSFIEGDIMTADLREMFQKTYGGGGVGFVPITSQVAAFRRSVAHKFGDWQNWSIVNSSSRGDYTISATTFEPKEDAFVEWKGSKYKANLGSFATARLLFINRDNTRIKATVNEAKTLEFTPPASPELQEIVVSDSISSIRFEFSSVDGFTAYGAFLENSKGVSLDNYSVRGNSGIPLSRVNHELCTQLDNISPYDLLVLEYGLNATMPDVTNYSGYMKQMTNSVEHLKKCFPEAAILVLSVSDRSTRVAGKFVTMQGIKAMEHTQHELAKKTGVAFWSTLDAMRQMGGMETFVENGWAAQDYTHLGAKGGAKVAGALFESLMFEKLRWEKTPLPDTDSSF